MMRSTDYDWSRVMPSLPAPVSCVLAIVLIGIDAAFMPRPCRTRTPDAEVEGAVGALSNTLMTSASSPIPRLSPCPHERQPLARNLYAKHEKVIYPPDATSTTVRGSSEKFERSHSIVELFCVEVSCQG